MSKKVRDPQYVKSKLNNDMLNYRIYVPKRLEKLLVYLALFLAGGLVGILFYGGLFTVDGEATSATYIADVVAFTAVGGIVLKLLSPVYWKHCLEKRNAELKNQFKAMLASLSSSMASGSNVQKAFEDALADMLMQYDENDHIVKEVREILAGASQNINLDVLVKDFGERSGNEDVVCFADVFGVCYHKGGNLRMIIQKTYQAINEKIMVSDEIETKLTSNKLQHNVMSIMPIMVVAMLKFTNDTFAENFATPIGVLVNTIAIGIFVASYRYGLKICDVKV